MSRRSVRRLKYLAQINQRDLPENTDPDYQFRYLDISAVGRGVLETPPTTMRFSEAPSRARRLVRSGDTLVSTVRTYLRAVWPVQGETDDLVVSTGFAVISPGPELEPRYFGWLAQSDPFIEEIVARSVGVSYPAINANELGELVVPAHALTEQKTVAEFLDRETARIDALIDAKRRMIGLLEERFRIGLEEIFAPYEGSPAPLGRFVLSISQGASPEADNRPADDGEWGVLKLSAVKNGRFVPSENKALPGGPSVGSLIPAVGDVLVTRSNTPAYVGDVCAVTVDPGKVLLPDLIYRLRLDRRLNPEFAAYALLRSRARHHFSATARGTSQSMVKLRGEDIKAAPVPVLALDRQVSLMRQLQQARAKTDVVIGHLGRQIQLLGERRQTLITLAVMGQLEIPRVAAA